MYGFALLMVFLRSFMSVLMRDVDVGNFLAVSLLSFVSRVFDLTK